jgi:hypothetical protein
VIAIPFDVPPLPAAARLDPSLGKGACPWLEDYVAWSAKWSPRAPPMFHESCGLFVLSTVAARRVVLRGLGKDRYTSLYLALVARTTLYSKSTTAELAISLLRAAGLQWLLCPSESTPRRFVYDMSGKVPANYEQLAWEERSLADLRLALPGQRGWFYEEFGQILNSMGDQGLMQDFRGHLKRLDDALPEFSSSTIARGEDKIERPYLALLADMTPADMQGTGRRSNPFWGDGFWARMAFSAPLDVKPRYDRFPNEARTIPSRLVKPLRDWHTALGMPSIRVDKQFPPPGSKQPPGFIVSRNPDPPRESPVVLADDVREAYYAYNDALLRICEARDNADLDGNYGRFAEKAVRVATLLAAISGDDVIELKHWARAQEISEGWRMCLHALVGAVNEEPPSKTELMEERVLAVVDKHPMLTASRVADHVRGLSTSEAQRVLDSLVAAGAVTASQSTRGARRYARAAELEMVS